MSLFYCSSDPHISTHTHSQTFINRSDFSNSKIKNEKV